MPKSDNQKLKILYILKYFLEYTDRKHGKTIKEIIAYLENYDIEAVEKTVRADLKLLIEYGYNIVNKKIGSNTIVYYIDERDFDVTELRILIDVVQSSKFLSEKTSKELIDKLSKLTSVYKANSLSSNVELSDRVKGNITKNNAIFSTVDKISSAIDKSKKITFKYREWVIDANKVKNISSRYKHGGKRYIVTPLALIYDDENYYLVAYEKETDKIKHFRTDKIENVDILFESRDKVKYKAKISKAELSKQLFGMYGGELATVKLKVANELIGVIVDRFSKKIKIFPDNDGTFTVDVSVMLSPQFYAWVFGLGKDIQILSPKEAVDGYRKQLKDTSKKYK